MGRHTIPERAQVELETFGIQSFLFDLLYEEIMLVDTLRPAR
jgi:hypothetical protein